MKFFYIRCYKKKYADKKKYFAVKITRSGDPEIVKTVQINILKIYSINNPFFFNFLRC